MFFNHLLAIALFGLACAVWAIIDRRHTRAIPERKRAGCSGTGHCGSKTEPSGSCARTCSRE